MKDRPVRLGAILLVALLAMSSTVAYAQGGATATLTGTVTDTSGGVVPGADIVVKHVATGAVYNTVSGADGTFTVPALPPGTYTATISLMGFKTTTLNDIILNVAVTSSVKAVLELGQIEETVVVAGATEIVQTQSAAVASVLNMKQIQNLPMVGRDAFSLVGYMPGVTTTTGSLRDGTINGLPQSTVNITLDGM
ncbi:MAG: carboxypeptidase regulatory-like domain-containing protein, partial [Vicinamibacterales bacterium]